MMKKHYLILLLLFVMTATGIACTSFVLPGEQVLLAKNLDWELDRGYLFFNLDGIHKTSIMDSSLTWTAKYKSITNNQFGKEFPLGGMNEAGLVIEELSLFGQPYTCDESKQLLNEFQWVQYQLDNSANISDVIQSLEKITIRHAIMNLHYLLADKEGNTAVVECLEAGVVVYSGEDLPYKVLSNNNYKEGIRYLGFFEGYGGEMKVQHRQGSQERFVSAVSMLDHFTPDLDALNYSFHILNTVKQEDTRWQFIYGLKDLSIKYKTHGISGEFGMGFEDLKKIRHNKFAIRLFGDKHKQVKMKGGKNKEHLKYIQGELDEYFPGNESIYDLMVIEGNKSLRTRAKKQTSITR